MAVEIEYQERPKKEYVITSFIEELQKMKDQIASLKKEHPKVDVAIRKVRTLFTQNIFDKKMPPKIQA